MFVLLLGIALLIAAESLILFTKNAPADDQFAVGIRTIFRCIIRPVALVLVPVGLVLVLSGR